MASSTTGETWTLTSTSTVTGVLRSLNFHGAGVDGVKFFDTTNGNSVVNGVLYEWRGEPIPEATLLGYKSEGSRTNLCLRSNAFTTTWTALGTPAATQNVTGPDGVANSAWTLTDNDAGVAEGISQAVTLTAAAYTCSIFVKKTTGAQSSYPVLWANIGTPPTVAPVTVDTSNGIATAWTAYTGYTIASGFSATCKSFNADFWRVEFTFTATAANWLVAFIPAGTTNPTQSTGIVDVAAQGSAVFYGAQVELGSFASSYIPTTTASVTRVADISGCSVASFISQTEGTMYCESSVNGILSANNVLALSDTTVDERIVLGELTTSDLMRVVDNGVTSATVAFPVPTLNQMYKRACSYIANSFNYARDGVLGTEDTLGTVPTVTYLSVCALYAGGNAQFGNLKNVAIWNKKLPDSALQDITE
jgi:hypothetical protein